MATMSDRSAVLTVIPGEKPTFEVRDEEGRYYLALRLSKEMHDRIAELARRANVSDVEILNRGVGPYQAVSDAIREGKRVGIGADTRAVPADHRVWPGVCGRRRKLDGRRIGRGGGVLARLLRKGRARQQGDQTERANNRLRIRHFHFRFSLGCRPRALIRLPIGSEQDRHRNVGFTNLCFGSMA